MVSINFVNNGFYFITVAPKSERCRDVPFLKLYQPTNVCTIYCCCKSGSVIKCFYCGDQMLTKADLSFRKGILGKNLVSLNRKRVHNPTFPSTFFKHVLFITKQSPDNCPLFFSRSFFFTGSIQGGQDFVFAFKIFGKIFSVVETYFISNFGHRKLTLF